MIKTDIKIGIDQTMVTGQCHIEVELSMDKILEEDCTMIKILDIILRKVILGECKILEVRILEVDIEVTLGIITLEEVEVGLEKDNTWVTLEEMRKTVLDHDQVQEHVLIETESDTVSVGRMIILPMTV